MTIILDGTTGITTPAINSSGDLELPGGTANGVLYLNGSKVATSGSALVFDGTNLGVGASSPNRLLDIATTTAAGSTLVSLTSATDGNCQLLFGDTDSDTQGKVFYDNVTDYMSLHANGAERLIITSAGNVGIGTSSPTHNLTVGSTSASDFVIALRGGVGGFFGWDDSANLTILQSPNTRSLSFQVNSDTFGAGTEAARIDSSGNLGLGVTPSAWNTTEFKAFQVGVGGSFYGRVQSGDQDKVGMSANAFYDQTDTRWEYIATDPASRYDQSNGGHYWYTAPSGTAGNTITFTNPMTLDASGDLLLQDTGEVFSTIRSSSTTGTRQATLRLNVASTGGNDPAGKLLFTVGNSYTSTAYIEATTNPDTMIFGMGSTERARITSGGDLLVGKTANDNTTAGIKLDSSGYASFVIANDYPIIANRLSSNGNVAVFRKDGTTVGAIASEGNDSLIIGGGTSLYTGLHFHGGVKNVVPVSNGSRADNVIDLGSSAFRFQDIWATNGTIQTSDLDEKQDIEELSEAERRAAVAAKGLLRKFRWKSSVDEKGDEARIHFGIIAQDLKAAFEAEGLDAGRYAMFIHSTWTDEETGEEHSRMGVRYSELLAFIISAI